MPKHTTKRVETVIYKGIAFRRYPESDRWSDANYYRPNSVHIKAGVKSLHIEIWQDTNGAVPDGCHIHHRDGDTSNNALDNLECITPADHNAHHQALLTDEQKEARREHAERIRVLASAWHRSEAGREWHKELGSLAWEHTEYRTYTCVFCDNEFQSRAMDQDYVLYCSNKCKTAARYKSGVDNEQRLCAFCNQPFTVNKYSRVKCCSRNCAQRLRRGDK